MVVFDDFTNACLLYTVKVHTGHTLDTVKMAGDNSHAEARSCHEAKGRPCHVALGDYNDYELL